VLPAARPAPGFGKAGAEAAATLFGGGTGAAGAADGAPLVSMAVALSA
jgi:hypothetical protein